MVRPTPQVDPEELDAFLATAPETLREWADAQREELGAAPGVEDLEDADTLPEDEAEATASTSPAPPAPLASRINKVLVALLAAAVVLLIQAWGRPAQTASSASAEPTVASSEAVELDTERVAELKAQAESNPTDPEPLRELARLHQDAQLWQEANDYRLKVLELVPDDFDALLAVGVYEFNTGEVDQAEQTWLKAVKAAPDKPEGYFNLGFVYLAKEPPLTEEAIASWEKVIEVAPDSELAATARTHIERIQEEQ